MSAFLKEQIEKELSRLRADCAVKREIKRKAFGRRWARAGRSNAENEKDCGPNDKYWDDKQDDARLSSTQQVNEADLTLLQFIAEHRSIMGPEWIGNDHGRLCWAPYLGGCPIGQHYCHHEEGHEGNHGNSLGAWPQGVTCEREWHEKKAKEEQP